MQSHHGDPERIMSIGLIHLIFTLACFTKDLYKWIIVVLSLGVSVFYNMSGLKDMTSMAFVVLSSYYPFKLKKTNSFLVHSPAGQEYAFLLLLLLAKECDLTPPLIYYPKQLFFFFRFVYLISLICFFKFCEEFPFVYVAAENQASLPKSKVMFVSHTVQF